MTAVAMVAPVDRESVRTARAVGAPPRVRHPRSRPATTSPDLRRPHPSARATRPAGAPAPTLRRAALPDELRQAITPTATRRAATPQRATARTAGIEADATSDWRLTDRAIALIMVALTVLVVTSVGVVVAKVAQVTSAQSGYGTTR